ncbi:DUF58 domain-containing protein [Falsirhodobacter xinxiangensis]|uniref:DUF58 domain-containing protein n=1 Tax=Falsirhodobacter xinxiangensis TaxID=2530049 RepID=UPI0010AB4368|nr:DUF58 domain-containing protein [Rhodobacter xinxiangensis]
MDPTVVTADALMALRHAPPRLPVTADRPGTTATRPRGQGHEIREIRPFATGDDPRHIDAAATARTGIPQIRSFHEDRDRALILIADFRRPMLWGTQTFRSVLAARALAVAGWQAEAAGGAVGVAAITDGGLFIERPMPRVRGMARVAGCLERAHAAALADARAATDLTPLLLRAARTAPRGAGIVLASSLDQPGDGLEAALGAILRRGPLRMIRAADPFEDAPPAVALPYCAGGVVRRGSFKAIPAHRAAFAARLRDLGVDEE